MIHTFIINPAAGNGKNSEALIAEIESLQQELNEDIRIFKTVGEMDGSVLASKLAEEAGGEIRIYACGGDGTINEIANGLYGHENAAMGIIPVGSGNDFVRSMDVDFSAFFDMRAQVNGRDMPIDLLKLTMESDDGTVTERMCINGTNIGLDGNTAIKAHDLKAIPGINGSMSYIVALASNFIMKKGENLSVTVDGAEIYNGPLLLCTAANGRFCGGGFESCPNARLDNGLIELLIVKNISRMQFIKLVPKYKAGRIFSVPGIDEYIEHAQAEKIEITANGDQMKFVADGEIMVCRRMTVEVLPKVLRVVVPQSETTDD